MNVHETEVPNVHIAIEHPTKNCPICLNSRDVVSLHVRRFQCNVCEFPMLSKISCFLKYITSQLINQFTYLNIFTIFQLKSIVCGRQYARKLNFYKHINSYHHGWDPTIFEDSLQYALDGHLGPAPIPWVSIQMRERPRKQVCLQCSFFGVLEDHDCCKF